MFQKYMIYLYRLLIEWNTERIERLDEIWETKTNTGALLAIGITFFAAVLEVFYAFEIVVRYLAVSNSANADAFDGLVL